MRDVRVLLSSWILLAACQPLDGQDVGDESSSTTAASNTSSTSESSATASESSGSESEADTGTETGSSSCTLDSCDDDEWCDWEPAGCGFGDTDGVCMPRPDNCDGEPSEPVCGCNQTVYDSACAAHRAGIDVAAGTAGCPALNGMFPCGPVWCSIESQYCEHYANDVEDEPDYYECRAIPNECVGMGCDCYLDSWCYDCSMVGGGLVVHCAA